MIADDGRITQPLAGSIACSENGMAAPGYQAAKSAPPRLSCQGGYDL